MNQELKIRYPEGEEPGNKYKGVKSYYWIHDTCEIENLHGGVWDAAVALCRNYHLITNRRLCWYSGNDKGHTKGSMHYENMALDISLKAIRTQSGLSEDKQLRAIYWSLINTITGADAWKLQDIVFLLNFDENYVHIQKTWRNISGGGEKWGFHPVIFTEDTLKKISKSGLVTLADLY